MCLLLYLRVKLATFVSLGTRSIVYDKLLTKFTESIFWDAVEQLQLCATEFKSILLQRVFLWLVSFVLEQCKGSGGVLCYAEY